MGRFKGIEGGVIREENQWGGLKLGQRLMLRGDGGSIETDWSVFNIIDKGNGDFKVVLTNERDGILEDSLENIKRRIKQTNTASKQEVDETAERVLDSLKRKFTSLDGRAVPIKRGEDVKVALGHFLSEINEQVSNFNGTFGEPMKAGNIETAVVLATIQVNLGVRKQKIYLKNRLPVGKKNRRGLLEVFTSV